MPRLLKVRMSNIILDEGKRVIPDLTWSPDGRDILFILENGRGNKCNPVDYANYIAKCHIGRSEDKRDPCKGFERAYRDILAA